VETVCFAVLFWRNAVTNRPKNGLRLVDHAPTPNLKSFTNIFNYIHISYSIFYLQSMPSINDRSMLIPIFYAQKIFKLFITFRIYFSNAILMNFVFYLRHLEPPYRYQPIDSSALIWKRGFCSLIEVPRSVVDELIVIELT